MDDDSGRRKVAVGTGGLLLGLPVTAAGVSFCLVTALCIPALGLARATRCGWVAAAMAAVCTLVAGVPAAHWALSSRRARLVEWLALGAIAGSVPLAVACLGYVAGAILRGQERHVAKTFQILIAMGVERIGLGDLSGALSTAQIEVLPVVIGAVTGALFWIPARRVP